MTFTRKDLIGAIKASNSDIEICSNKLAQLVRKHGIKCVTLLCGLKLVDRKKMGFKGTNISTILVKTAGKLVDSNGLGTVFKIHFLALNILDNALFRNETLRESIPGTYEDIYFDLLTEELDDSDFPTTAEEGEISEKDGAIKTTKALISNITKQYPDLTTDSAEFLWRNGFKKEASEVAAKIDPDDYYYEDAYFYLGAYAIESSRGSTEACRTGLELLDKIGSKNDNHVNQSKTTKKYYQDAWFYIGVALIKPDSSKEDLLNGIDLLRKIGDDHVRHGNNCKQTRDSYQNACLQLGLASIENGNGLYESYHIGLEYLLEIGGDHEKHPEKCEETKGSMNKAIAKIKEMKKGMQGFIVKDEMAIVRGAKNPGKRCEIGDIDPNNTGLTLHERQSLVERIVSLNGNGNQLSNHNNDSRYNQMVVSIGFIITDRPWRKGGNHRRVFCSMPLLVNNETTDTAYDHTEPHLFYHLLTKSHLKRFVTEFKKKFSIKSDGHKIYGAIIDCHSRFDMCKDCYRDTQIFYSKWETLLPQILSGQGFKLPKPRNPLLFGLFKTASSLNPTENPRTNEHFTITTRYTSNTDYTKGKRREIPKTAQAIDLRMSDRHLIIHGSNEWHSKWTKGADYAPHASSEEINIENWTVLSTRFSPSSKRKNPKINYSRLGRLSLLQYSLWQEIPNPPAEQLAGLNVNQ